MYFARSIQIMNVSTQKNINVLITNYNMSIHSNYSRTTWYFLANVLTCVIFDSIINLTFKRRCWVDKHRWKSSRESFTLWKSLQQDFIWHAMLKKLRWNLHLTCELFCNRTKFTTLIHMIEKVRTKTNLIVQNVFKLFIFWINECSRSLQSNSRDVQRWESLHWNFIKCILLKKFASKLYSLKFHNLHCWESLRENLT